jgi:hypothetical protein
MTKTLLLSAAAALAVMASTASADVYKGRIQYVADNGECAGGPNVGDRDNAVFHEYRDVSGERFTALNIFWSYGGDGHRLNADLPVDGMLADLDDSSSVGNDPYNPLNNPNAVQKMSISAKTKSGGTIIMEGQLLNPWGDEALNDCIMTYLYTGLKK